MTHAFVDLIRVSTFFSAVITRTQARVAPVASIAQGGEAGARGRVLQHLIRIPYTGLVSGQNRLKISNETVARDVGAGAAATWLTLQRDECALSLKPRVSARPTGAGAGMLRVAGQFGLVWVA